jgi:uncharacterized protein (UPF0261 family)
MAEKLNRAKGPVTVLYPQRGFDDFDKEVGGVFYNPEGHATFLEVLKKNLKSSINVIELDSHINDQDFADAALKVFDDIHGKQIP